jgi:hypothetical protein
VSLPEHFALTDTGNDEPSEWRPVEVIEGELDAGWPNRMRRLLFDPELGTQYEIQVNGNGDPLRVRLPFRMPDPLSCPIVEPNEWHYEETGEFGAHGQPLDDLVIDSVRKRWFEQVGEETHMLIQVVA